jgi:hypothetical protein
MKKFNLKNEIIVVQKSKLLEAIDSAKPFAITIEGEIIYEPFVSDKIYIYQGSMKSSAKPLQELFTNAYRVVEDDERVLIKAANAWGDIIKYNKLNCDYDDTSSDGIGDFSDSKLEDMGWNATEFDIKYRELSELLERECDGVLLCVEIEEPYQFSGLGFIYDRECAYKKVFQYCKEKIAYAIENDPDFNIESLTDDEREAAEFFDL